jgi:hypothetical protein
MGKTAAHEGASHEKSSFWFVLFKGVKRIEKSSFWFWFVLFEGVKQIEKVVDWFCSFQRPTASDLLSIAAKHYNTKRP